MGELGRLIQAHIDEQKYPVSNARLAEAVGVTRQTISNWVAGTSMPDQANLKRLAHVIETPYSRVLDAALVDAGYLPKERERGNAATTKAAGRAPADQPVIEARALTPPSVPPSEASPRTAAGPRRRGRP